MTEFTDQAVYFVLEHAACRPDPVVLLFEDDPETLAGTIEYCIQLAESESRICTGEFHAAEPDDEFLEVGDWYLRKCHGVGVSHGLETGPDVAPPPAHTYSGP
jgi:hypothetical protein